MTFPELVASRVLDQQRNNGSPETIRVLNELREAAEALERQSPNGEQTYYVAMLFQKYMPDKINERLELFEFTCVSAAEARGRAMEKGQKLHPDHNVSLHVCGVKK